MKDRSFDENKTKMPQKKRGSGLEINKTAHIDIDEYSNLAQAKSRKFGKYQLFELLGEGGMGKVYKAYDEQLDRWVALKFLLHLSPDSLERFSREAHAVAKLSHPHIVDIYEAKLLKNTAYIAFEFVDGYTLDSYIKVARIKSFYKLASIFNIFPQEVLHFKQLVAKWRDELR